MERGGGGGGLRTRMHACECVCQPPLTNKLHDKIITQAILIKVFGRSGSRAHDDASTGRYCLLKCLIYHQIQRHNRAAQNVIGFHRRKMPVTKRRSEEARNIKGKASLCESVPFALNTCKIFLRSTACSFFPSSLDTRGVDGN